MTPWEDLSLVSVIRYVRDEMHYEFPDFGRNPRRTLWSQYITVPEGRNGKICSTWRNYLQGYLHALFLSPFLLLDSFHYMPLVPRTTQADFLVSSTLPFSGAFTKGLDSSIAYQKRIPLKSSKTRSYCYKWSVRPDPTS